MTSLCERGPITKTFCSNYSNMLFYKSSIAIFSMTIFNYNYVISLTNEWNALWNFCRLVECTTHRSCFDYIGYGCWCGMGGGGSIVDQIDKCCQQHDNCYRRVELRYGCQEAGYFDHYYAECIRFEGKNIPICSYKNDKCEEEMCECDARAAVCFATYPYGARSKGQKPSCPDYIKFSGNSLN